MNQHVKIDRRITFTPMQKERIRIMAAAGKTDVEIGHAVGHHYKSIQAMRKKLGIPAARSAPRPWTDTEVDRLAELFAGGLSDEEIAAQMDRTTTAITGKRQSVGIVKAPQALPQTRGRLLSVAGPCPINAPPEDKARACVGHLIDGLRAGHHVYRPEDLPALYRARAEA